MTFYDISKDGDISNDQLRKLGDVLTDTQPGQTTIQVRTGLAKRLGINDLVVGTTNGVDTDTRVLDVALIPGAFDLDLVTVTLSKGMTATSIDQIVEFFDVSNKKNVDEYTNQLGVRALPNTSYPTGFDTFIESVTHSRIYMDEDFVGLELAAYGDAFAVMGKDPARGRAISSEGQITGVEVIYPGSGYTEIPAATISGGGGTGAIVGATVSGGIYELKINSAGFSYVADKIPGYPAGVLRNSELSLFDNEFGKENPLVDFGERNTSLQGGNVQFPGEGLEIIGLPGTEAIRPTNFERHSH